MWSFLRCLPLPSTLIYVQTLNKIESCAYHTFFTFIIPAAYMLRYCSEVIHGHHTYGQCEGPYDDLPWMRWTKTSMDPKYIGYHLASNLFCNEKTKTNGIMLETMFFSISYGKQGNLRGVPQSLPPFIFAGTVYILNSIHTSTDQNITEDNLFIINIRKPWTWCTGTQVEPKRVIRFIMTWKTKFSLKVLTD